MKSLVEYINESIEIFTDDDRDSLIEVVGNATGNLGEDSDIKKYQKFIDELSDDDKKNLDDLYDMLDNEETYPKLYKRLFAKDEKLLLKKLAQYAFDNDICDLSTIIQKF